MAVTWTLKYNGVTKNFDSTGWGLKSLTRVTRSKASDTVEFDAVGRAFDAASLFPYHSIIEIFRVDTGVPTRFFYGRIVSEPRAGEAESESIHYVAAGPWDWLEESLQYKQVWYVGSPPVAQFKTRINLNQAADGSKVNTGDQITDVLNYAIARGVPLQVGDIGVEADPPMSTVLDQLCSEVIKNQLNWTPDAVTWFDYSGSGYPTFHIKRRGDLVQEIVDVNQGKPVNAIKITPRPERLKNGVVILFEQPIAINDGVFDNTITDKFPIDVDPLALDVLTMTIDLQGPRYVVQTQAVKTESITAGLASWWEKHKPELRSTDVSGLTVVAYDVDTQGVYELDEDGNEIESEITKELVEGACPSWKPDTTKKVIVRARLSYTSQNADGAGSQYHEDVVACDITGTTLSTQTYQDVSIADLGEAVPVGLAEQYYDAISVLEYEGSVTYIRDEIGGAPAVGKVLNITGSADHSEWASMKALIQQVTEEVDTGTTTVTVGPAEHLSVQDMIELTRANRQRLIPLRLERASGSIGGSQNIKGAHNTPLENASGSGAAKVKQMFVKDDTEITIDATAGGVINVFNGTNQATIDLANGLIQITDGSKSIELRLSDLPGSGVGKFRSVKVCVDGVQKDAYVLMTVPT